MNNLDSRTIWNVVPKLCKHKRCPYRAFVFEYRPGGRYYRPRVTGYCLLHGKEAFGGSSNIIFRSRKELEDMLLTSSIMEG